VIPRGDGPVSSLRRFLYMSLPPLRWRVRVLQMDYRESLYSAVTEAASPFADQIRAWCTAMIRRSFPTSQSYGRS
jgi:hypothetical protein